MRHLRFGSPSRAAYAHNSPAARCLQTRRLTHTVKPHRDPILVVFLVYAPQYQLGPDRFIDRLDGTVWGRAALRRWWLASLQVREICFWVRVLGDELFAFGAACRLLDDKSSASFESPLLTVRYFSSAGSKLLSSLLLKPRDQFVDILRSQVEMQSLVVLSQPMLRHMDRHRDARGIWPLRVLPLQLAQSNCADSLGDGSRPVRLRASTSRPQFPREPTLPRPVGTSHLGRYCRKRNLQESRSNIDSRSEADAQF
jgi:hypothetical protein